MGELGSKAAPYCWYITSLIYDDILSGEYQNHETNDANIRYTYFMIRHYVENIHIAH